MLPEPECNGDIVYEVQDLVDWRFITVEHKYCADDKKKLKGIKRISKGIKVR